MAAYLSISSGCTTTKKHVILFILELPKQPSYRPVAGLVVLQHQKEHQHGALNTLQSQVGVVADFREEMKHVSRGVS